MAKAGVGTWLIGATIACLLYGSPSNRPAFDRAVAPLAQAIVDSANAQAKVPPVLPQMPAPAQPVTGDLTPTQWASALLARLGAPQTPANLRAVTGWERAEGGHWHDAARFNPLNTTQREPGSYPINSVGVQAFTSWDQGLTATVQTLRNGRYGGVLAALAAGNCAPCVADAVAASPWGTGRFTP